MSVDGRRMNRDGLAKEREEVEISNSLHARDSAQSGTRRIKLLTVLSPATLLLDRSSYLVDVEESS